MRNSAIAIVLTLSALVCVSGELKKLQIGVKHRPADCTVKAAPGDKVSVHYEGRLTDGTVFDSSYKRDQPISFPLGAGQVIKGWDQGISGMCVGEKRKLKVIDTGEGPIPSHLGYGDQGSPPTIPGQVLAVVSSPSKSFVTTASAHVLDHSFSKYPTDIAHLKSILELDANSARPQPSFTGRVEQLSVTF